jgi:hypothetical protein
MVGHVMVISPSGGASRGEERRHVDPTAAGVLGRIVAVVEEPQQLLLRGAQ